MSSKSRAGYGWIALVTSALAACAGADPQDTSSSEQEQGVLAVVESADGHKLKLLELSPGALAVVETARGTDADLSFNEDLTGLTPSQVYAKMAPGSAVPKEVAEADSRFQAGSDEPLAAPPTPAGSTGKGPSLYSDEEQAWFRATQCVNAICIQGWDWARTDVLFYKWLKFIGFVNSGGNPSFLMVYRWDGSRWVVGAQTLIPSGHFGGMTISSSSAKYFYGEMVGVGNHQLSMAISGPFVVKDGLVK